MNQSDFSGVMTAIVTPFDANENIDFGALGGLIEDQLQNGIKGIVFAGTTGESPTLSEEEKLELFSFANKTLAGRAFFIAGTGSNNTKNSVNFSKQAKDRGAEALLLVTPYYNKPTQEGLFLHYQMIAQETGLPCILYNVPGRTGVHLEPKTVARLAEISNIVAVKEATGKMEVMREIRELCGDKINILSGDDGTYLEALKIGADGLISVGSNVMPGAYVALTNFAKNGQMAEAEKVDQSLRSLYEALFIESNPIPVKACLHLMEKIRYQFRLPLCPAAAENMETIKQVCQALQLI